MRLERVAATIVVAVFLTYNGMNAAEGETAPKTGETTQTPSPSGGLGLMHNPMTNPWKSAGPKAEHQILAGLVGKAETVVHVEKGPFPRGKETKGTAEAKLLLGGLFVQVTQTGTRMKEPFERIIIYGFDAVTGKYTADVMDTISPNIVHYSGTYDAKTRKFTMTSKYHEVGGRRYVTARLVTSFVDEKIWTYEEFLSPGPDQPEAQVSLVVLTRAEPNSVAFR